MPKLPQYKFVFSMRANFTDADSVAFAFERDMPITDRLIFFFFFLSLNLFFYIENKTGLTTDSNIDDECKSMELALLGGGAVMIFLACMARV